MKPIINDITTSFTDPPQFIALKKLNPKKDYTYPAQFSEKQRLYYIMVPIKLNITSDKAFEVVSKVASRQANWEIVESNPVRRSIEAVATSKFFKFKDDVVIEIRPGEKEQQIEIHMRSKSRIGRADFGTNHLRIKKFFNEIYSSLD